jgi:hypothetical protein
LILEPLQVFSLQVIRLLVSFLKVD